MRRLGSIAIVLCMLLVAMNAITSNPAMNERKEVPYEGEGAEPPILYAPPLPSTIKIWEAWAKGYVTIVQTDYGTYTVSNNGPASVVIDEYTMLLSPSPANPSEDLPFINDETQDGVLTTINTILPGNSLVFNYGLYVALGVEPPPPWWCTEDSEFTHPNVPITLGGEILPYAMVPFVENMDVMTQDDLYYHMRNNPTLLIGKLPLWAEIANVGDEVDITLEVTNIGFLDATNVVVTDILPPGYSYDPTSFTQAPSSITNNPDGSITITWDVALIDAAVETPPEEPTDYSTVYIGYKLLTPILDPDIRIFLPRAYVDKNGNGINNAESAEPLLETYLVNRPPVALAADVVVLEGQVLTLDGTGSYDPDEPYGDYIVSYEWDTDMDGIFDANGPMIPYEYGDNGDYTVMLKVTDTYGFSDSNIATITVLNDDPSVQIQAMTMNCAIGLRVAGSKWSNVNLTLYENGVEIGWVEVERWPSSPSNNPSVGSIPAMFDLNLTYEAVVRYDPYPDDGDEIEGDQGNNGKDRQNNAGNPVWLTLDCGNESKWIHHTFNTQQSKKKGSDHWNHVEPWHVDIKPELVGMEFTMVGLSDDPGSDDLTFDWSFGAQSQYYNDPSENPDPYPSPWGTYPFDATDTVVYTYNGPETVSLTVTDDDGGSTTATLTLG